MKTIVAFPSRASGMQALASILEEHELEVSQGERSVGRMATRFFDVAEKLRGPERDGFMLAVGWWIAMALNEGPISADGLRAIIERRR